jgi:tripeptide aminopeptidase
MPAAADAIRATPEERDRLLSDFVRYCEIESVSGNERALADAVTADLRELGLEVREDESGSETGSNAGNLLARIEGPPGSRSIVLCAHLDTVPLDAPVEVALRGRQAADEQDTEFEGEPNGNGDSPPPPARREGWFENANEAILGADNKAALVVMMEVARRAVRDGAPVGIELLFTTAEELALKGAKAFDLSHLRSEFGFVFDHATAIGEIIVAAPTYYRIDASFHGHAAHAGIRPEDGRNAIAAAATGIASLELGRLDPQTTANAGVIKGGTAGNVVAERCDVMLECRSIDHDRAHATATRIVDSLTAAASDSECDVEIDVEEQFRGYKLARTGPPVAAAAAALEAVGFEPTYVQTGGGSDANAFIARGFPCVNLANGTERNHQPDERVSTWALEEMLDVALNLVRASARPGPTDDSGN